MINKDNIAKAIFKNDYKFLSPLSGGMMNLSFIIEKENKKYVLYIPTEQANEMVDRKLEKENIEIAYVLSITSKNYFFDTKTGIKVNEYIDGYSLDKIKNYDYEKIAALFKKMHSSKKLSSSNYKPFYRLLNLYEKEALSFQPIIDEKYKKIRELLLKNQNFLEKQELVFCHNDAQKSNIIKSEKGEYFIIDFEFAGNNDPIYDIATFGNNSVEEGRTLLSYYFKNMLDEKKIKRFYLWRMFISLQWYNVAIVKHYRGEGKQHGFDFLKVADYFLNNALECYNKINQ